MITSLTLLSLGLAGYRQTTVAIPTDKAERAAILLEMCEAPSDGSRVGGPKVRRTDDIIPLLLEVADNDLSVIRRSVVLYDTHQEPGEVDWIPRRDVLDILAKIVWDLPSNAPGWANGGPMAPLAVKKGKLVLTYRFPPNRTGVWFTFDQFDHIYGKGKRRDLAPFRAQRIPPGKLDSMIRDAMRDVPVKNGVWQLKG